MKWVGCFQIYLERVLHFTILCQKVRREGCEMLTALDIYTMEHFSNSCFQRSSSVSLQILVVDAAVSHSLDFVRSHTPGHRSYPTNISYDAHVWSWPRCPKAWNLPHVVLFLAHCTWSIFFLQPGDLVPMGLSCKP